VEAGIRCFDSLPVVLTTPAGQMPLHVPTAGPGGELLSERCGTN